MLQSVSPAYIPSYRQGIDDPRFPSIVLADGSYDIAVHRHPAFKGKSVQFAHENGLGALPFGR